MQEIAITYKQTNKKKTRDIQSLFNTKSQVHNDIHLKRNADTMINTKTYCGFIHTSR